ncbi:MAG: phosphoribosylformylglycinamidine synthase subunit PurQ [Treponema sp.]|jgi:L-2-hydroxyglutarate oxidase LhgO/phosphoribosylformylglycinamidine (FGAM) synthase-like amidotransferase family enzyme|nr:phosphoribosylformylglycinamidine synthase subunit PurQ [Treponema sp.]
MYIQRGRMLEAIKNTLKEALPDLEPELFMDERGILTIKGECAAWEEVVAAGHLAAAPSGVKNVVNELSVRGKPSPRKDYAPYREMGMKAGRIDTVDVLVVGAGISGCAVARELSKYRLRIIVVEKGDDAASGATKANNGNIHPGHDVKPGTLKAKLNIRGNEMYTQWAKELGFEFQRCGLMGAVTDIRLRPLLEKAAEGARAMGVFDPRVFDGEEAKRLEPGFAEQGIEPAAAIWLPSMGLVEPYKVAMALAENAAINGVRFLFNCTVADILTREGRISGALTSRGVIEASYIINCAGVYADEISAMAGDKCYTIHPRKGTIAILDKNRKPVYHALAGILGDTSRKKKNESKGGGMCRTPEWNVLMGPSATEVPDKEDLSSTPEDLAYAMGLGERYGIGYGDIIRFFAGSRPADYKEDFFIELSPVTRPSFVRISATVQLNRCMFWQGEIIADLPRVFLNTNGAPRRAKARISAGENVPAPDDAGDAALSAGELLKNLERELGSLRSGSRRGLQERFDGSIGAASVLFPWGGETQGTPECGMAALIPSLTKESLTASLMSFGYDPDISARDPYEGAKGAVREALAKFVCLGGQYRKARLSFQEYFERTDSPESWGKPAAALLGALEAQLALAVPAIGGKDSMSGSYQDEERGISLAVPPSLAAFAAGTVPARLVRSGALSGEAGNIVLLLSQGQAAGALEAGEGEWERFKANMETLEALNRRGLVKAAYPVGPGGIAASLALMAFGNMTGLEVYAETLALAGGDACQGSALVELSGAGGAEAEIARGRIAARTLDTPVYRILGAAAREEAKPSAVEVPLAALRRAYESPLAQVYPQTSREAPITEEEAARARAVITGYSRKAPRKTPRFKTDGKPLAVLPVFPGTNCEWDMERAFRKAGARTRLVVFRNRNQEDIAESIAELAAAIGEAQILALSGGFSAGDEPDGSGKFIANVFRSQAIADAAASLLEDRDGLALGICNGFQALIKLGLVPYGTSRPADETMPTLTFNRIGRHVSRMVRTRVMSTMSPWLSLEEPGAIQVIPVSHGEGRVVIREDEAAALFRAGQVPFCYAGAAGEPALSEPDNPNGSDFAIEALTSPDGRVLGKMGHSERCGDYVHINIPGNKRQRIFEAGVRYFE